MKIFHCDHCRQPIFFENVHCLSCDHPLAFLPDLEDMGSLELMPDGFWRSPLPSAAGRAYRLCANRNEDICNWAVRADDGTPLCRSCRLTRVIPNLSQAGHKEAWYRLEVAKRRLIYSLLTLRLPLLSKAGEPSHGLAFEFLADPGDGTARRVFTGHLDGLITINLEEADDARRERRRLELHEPYRTLLGHFRHESGHYYWDTLLAESDRLAVFRALFGDERADYGAAQQRHYAQGAPPDWQTRFISAYASSHPWEDWAETWAHYLHMTDALETAAATGLALRPPRAQDPSLKPDPQGEPSTSFERMIRDWLSLTYVLNNLNRGLGLPDSYPFVLSPGVIGKLRFVHETIERCARSR